MSIMSMLVAGGGGAFTPLSLFSGGVQGVWYDPSDLTTMFTDSAGTTPVGTPGNGSAQPVGLLLDKSQNGVGTNGAYRYNLLTYTEQFDNAAWLKSICTVTADTVVAPDGTTTADTITCNNGQPYGLACYRTGISVSSSTSYRISFYAKNGTAGWCSILFGDGGANAARINFNLSTGTVGSSETFGSGWSYTASSASITAAANGWYRCSATFVSGGTSAQVSFGSANADNSASISNGQYNYYWGAQLALATASTAYQKITSDWVSTMAGNHATQSTASARPELSALYNFIQRTEQFSNAYWAKGFCSVTDNATTAPDGTNTACLLTEDSSNYGHNVYPISNPTGANAATSYRASVCFKQGTRRYGCMQIATDGATKRYSVVVDLQTGSVTATNSVGSPIGTSYTVDALANGFYRVTVYATNTSGAVTLNPSISDVAVPSAWYYGSPQYTGNGTSGAYIWGADLRVANDGVGLPAYQRVVDTLTYDAVGFPYYIKGDGATQYMRCSSFIMPLISRMQVVAFCQWQKSSDFAGVASVYPSSGNDFTPTNAFNDQVYTTATDSFAIQACASGTTYLLRDQTPTQISLRTVYGELKAPADGRLRKNGTQIAQTTSFTEFSTQSDGGLLLFVRGYPSGSSISVYSSTRLYGLIMRGAASTTTDMQNTETWMNGKVKAY